MAKISGVLARTAALLGVCILAYLSLKLVPLPPLQDARGCSKALFDSKRELVSISLSADEKYRLIVPYRDFSEPLIQATLLYEDRHFFHHPGVNPFSLVRGALLSALHPERPFGGSTITMQLARLRLGMRTRSVLGKLQQVLWALAIESQYSKQDILESYLNQAPYGANIEGAAAAGLIYFRKPSSQLTADEAITLAVLPQYPAVRWKAKGKANLQAAQSELLRRWTSSFPDKPAIPKDLVHSAAQVPASAPHFFHRLQDLYPRANQYYSTLDHSLQETAEEVLTTSLKQFADYGLTNGAILLTEAPGMNVRAYVGSAGYLNPKISGYVNGLNAPRSPGSLLKPFVYALALEQGQIIPETMLSDLPIRLASYRPENFERNFLGPISAGDALIKSRNIPALEVFRLLHPGSLYQYLVRSGVNRLKAEEHYGIALVLGGLGVTAEETAGLYGVLLNQGAAVPLRFLSTQDAPPRTILLSPESAHLTRQMLAKNPPALARFRSQHIPWKTGTSFGARDAWAAGIVGQYVMVVWVGNFDGKPNANLIGRDVAGPIFFTMVERLLARGVFPVAPASAGLKLKELDVCALSGKLPGGDCPHRKQSWFIPGVSPIDTCNLHKRIEIEPGSGLRLCPGEHGGQQRVYEVWDSSMQTLFHRAGLRRTVPPPYLPRCDLPGNSSTLRIVSPEEHLEYYLEAHRKLELEFLASVPGEAKMVSWFVDNTLVAQVAPDAAVHWAAKAGTFQVRAVDDLGNSSLVQIRVATQGE